MTIEVTAKKIDDAISQGLKQLGASLDEVNVEVVEAGGLFRKAKVRITLEREDEKAQPTAQAERTAPPVKTAESKPTNSDKPQPKQEKKAETAQPVNRQAQSKNDGAPSEQKRSAKNNGGNASAAAQGRKPESDGKKAQAQDKAQEQGGAVQPQSNGDARGEERKPRKLSAEDKVAAAHALAFIKDVTEKMGFVATVEADDSGENISISAAEGDDSLIIGRHGETLSALSYLAETCARAEKSHISITVYCNGYRERRAASLNAMARRRANECAAKRRKIKLEPMERVDRRTVHNALTDDDRVTTASEGKEPYRCVVILPKSNKSSSNK